MQLPSPRSRRLAGSSAALRLERLPAARPTWCTMRHRNTLCLVVRRRVHMLEEIFDRRRPWMHCDRPANSFANRLIFFVHWAPLSIGLTHAQTGNIPLNGDLWRRHGLFQATCHKFW
jgi:hypothetical protein